MKAASAKQIRDELKNKEPADLLQLCLRLSRFKKENKELMTYLLFEAQDEDGYISHVREWIEEQFGEINGRSFYHAKKGVRSILKNVKKYIRYSGNKETEVRLLIAFCDIYQNSISYARRRLVFRNIFEREVELIKKRISLLHEDLQYDYGLEVDKLLE